MRDLIAGIDLGGTNVRIALAEKETPERLICHRKVKTPVEAGPEGFLKVVIEGVAECLEELGASKNALAGLGCTIPGITDAPNGIAVLVTNLPGWEQYPIRSTLEQAMGVPVAVDNDVNAAALGEYWCGQGKGRHSLVYLTVSTGIAAGIVTEGRLLRGRNHAAGEMGFFMPDPRLLDQDWMPNGCLELTSAGVGLVRAYKRKKGDLPDRFDARDIFEAARQGDQDAREVVDDAANYLAQAVIALAAVIDPELFILSGSIVQHQQQMVDRIQEMVEKHIPHSPEILMSGFDGDAPIIGALSLIARKLTVTG